MSTTDGIATVAGGSGMSAVSVGGEAMAILAREGALHLRWLGRALRGPSDPITRIWIRGESAP